MWRMNFQLWTVDIKHVCHGAGRGEPNSQSVQISASNLACELWVMTDRARFQIQVAGMILFTRVAGVSPPGWGVWKFKRTYDLRWEQPLEMIHQPGEMFHAKGDLMHDRDIVSELARERLEFSLLGADERAGEKRLGLCAEAATAHNSVSNPQAVRRQ